MIKGDKRVLYRRKNSSLRDVDVGELLALVSSWTTLAHEGAALESEGLADSMVGCCWVPPPTPPVQPAIYSYEGGGREVGGGMQQCGPSLPEHAIMQGWGVVSLLSPLTVLQPHPWGGGMGQVA
jgi:hypothetical protein